MSKSEKLITRFLSFPKDFTYNELRMLLLAFGYKEIQGTGARVCFVNENHKIKLHKPHPSNVLRRYQLNLIAKELTNKGLI